MEAVIFDLDNTLLDLIRMKQLCIEAAVDGMIDAGLDMQQKKAEKMLFDLYGHNIEDQRIFQKFLKEATGKVDPKILAYAIIAYRRVKAGLLSPYPGTKRTLVALKEMGLKLAVVSDAPRNQAWHRLCILKLDDFFDVVVTYEDTHRRKPDPAPFRRALKALRMKPEDALMVGDWPERDMQGAKKLGMKTAFAKYGNTTGYKGKVADFTLNKITDLTKIVSKNH